MEDKYRASLETDFPRIHKRNTIQFYFVPEFYTISFSSHMFV